MPHPDPYRYDVDHPAVQSGQIPTEHGLEAVPPDGPGPFVAPLVGGVILLALAGWLIFGPAAEPAPPRPTAEAPAAEPPILHRALEAPDLAQ